MAARFLVAGGDGNWSSINNWAASSGGASGQTAPVAGDTVAFDSLSGNANMTVNVASACTSLVMSGTYAGTLTFSAQLTVAGTVTFLSTCTLAGTTGPLVVSATATLTSGGRTLPCPLNLTGIASYTLADNWAVNGLVSSGSGGSTSTINSFQITCNGGFRNVATSASGHVSGTTKLVMAGGTWDATSGGVTDNSVDLAGNVTVSGAVAWGATGKTLTYVSGTITTTGSTISSAAATTWNVAGVTWNNVSFNGTAITYTLSSDLAWSGTLTLGNSSTITIAGAGKFNGTGTATVSGVSTILLTNTGGLVTTGALSLPNSNCTFGGTSGFTVGTLTTASLTGSRTYTLTFGNVYVVTGTISNVGTTATIREAIVSSSAGNRVVLKLQTGGSCDLLYCDPTDVNSSGGQQIFTARGTISNSLNWTNVPSAGGGGAPVIGSAVVRGLGVVS